MRASHQPTREAARRYLVEVEARIARGRIGIPEPAADALTVAALCERFLTQYSRPRIKDLDTYRRNARTALRRAFSAIGSHPAEGLQRDDLLRLRSALCRTHAPASVRVTLSYLAAVYAWAVGLRLVTQNPLRGIERPAATTSVEFLSRDEVTQLLRTAEAGAGAGAGAEECVPDQLLYAIVHLALHTGLRKGELLGLRWLDLDLAMGRLTVARSFRTLPKSNKPRHLRLPAVCLPVLKAWQSSCPQTAENLVFPVGRRGVFGMGTRRDLLGLPALMKRAGCRPTRHPFHLLRHTFASHFIMSGGNLLTLQKILGHSDVKMTQIYAHLGPEFLTGEMDRLKF
jgi:integrase